MSRRNWINTFYAMRSCGQPRKPVYICFGLSTYQIFDPEILWGIHLARRKKYLYFYTAGINVCGPLFSKILKQSKNNKNAFFACFRPYTGQSDNHIGWTTSMPFASIYFTHPRTNPWNFYETILRKCQFFWVSQFVLFFKKIFFLLHPNEN